MSEISTKPYLLRAIYEWCTDNGYTPYLAAMVDAKTHVPREFVKNGEIVLNISFTATSGLKLDNDAIYFNARFGGVSREIYIPVDNVIAIYARENGQGMAFEVTRTTDQEQAEASQPSAAGTENSPVLSAVPSAKSDQGSEPGSDGSNTDPEPPKKGNGKPTLTRIK